MWIKATPIAVSRGLSRADWAERRALVSDCAYVAHDATLLQALSRLRVLSARGRSAKPHARPFNRYVSNPTWGTGSLCDTRMNLRGVERSLCVAKSGACHGKGRQD